MRIRYGNERVEKCFSDYGKMKKKIPQEWVRNIKKHLDRLEASENYGIFLSLGLGKPEQLKGYKDIVYSLHVSANVRLIIKLNVDSDKIEDCQEIEILGVCDYHGGKENWYIP